MRSYRKEITYEMLKGRMERVKTLGDSDMGLPEVVFEAAYDILLMTLPFTAVVIWDFCS